ncbi:SPOR domain-containing protein [Micrococcus endophyticus]|uniref:SPOR domain-containing protein n=1 Tax=Micrococcus endophyticus TaxID=455343 RepID=UPI002003BF68|nr:SPOR domain-containing protein [Micrococcus endophyticus]MCK6090080.1 SPOR domain-containing protein [Micrococcus endophyticus]
MSEKSEYWYNVRTQQVEEGAQSDWSQLLGPFGTREEAQSAMSRVQANNEAADAADERDDHWDNNPFNDAD